MHETPIGLIPYLTILDGKGDEALDFYEKALGAEVFVRDHGESMPNGPAPGGKVVHGRMRVNGALIFLSDDFPEWKEGRASNPPGAVSLHLQVDDVESWWRRALDAGCSVKFPLADQFWGDRFGAVEDPFGHSWSFGQTLASA